MPATWQVVSASVAGTAHVAAGFPCQDRFACEARLDAAGESVVVAAVADGASSAAEGGLGAETAAAWFVATAVEALETCPLSRLGAADVKAWVEAARSAVLLEAEFLKRPARDLACTLAGIVLAPELALTAQIGDGLIALQTEAGWELAFWPQKGEHRNETRFITDATAPEHIANRLVAASITALGVGSDGVEDLCIDRAAGTVFAPFFAGLVDTIRGAPGSDGSELDAGLARYLASERVNAVTDDDKTLVLVLGRAPA